MGEILYSAYCRLRAVPLRALPSHRAEMVSQLLCGDTVAVLEEAGGWSRLRCDYDGYEGWADSQQIVPLAEGCDVPARLAAAGRTAGHSPSRVAEEQYLGAPYLWGGRTAWGIDCSGLAQVCFKACGIALLRDASQQAGQGTLVKDFADIRRDDLCFFQNEAGRVVHVGISLGGGRIIHASGEVRIDSLTPDGIFNQSLCRLTHRLHSVRRLL